MPLIIDALVYTDFISSEGLLLDGVLITPIVFSRKHFSSGAPHFIHSFAISEPIATLLFENETSRATIKYSNKLSLSEPLDSESEGHRLLGKFDYPKTREFLENFVFLQHVQLSSFMKLTRKFIREVLLDRFAHRSLDMLFLDDCNVNQFFIGESDDTLADLAVEILEYPKISETLRKSTFFMLINRHHCTRLVQDLSHRIVPSANSKILHLLAQNAMDLSFSSYEVNEFALLALRTLIANNKSLELDHFKDGSDDDGSDDDGRVSPFPVSHGAGVFSAIRFCLACRREGEIQAQALYLLYTVLTGLSPEAQEHMSDLASLDRATVNRVAEFLTPPFCHSVDDILEQAIEIGLDCSGASSQFLETKRNRARQVTRPLILVIHALVLCSPKINLIPLMINKWKLLSQILPWSMDYRFGVDFDDVNSNSSSSKTSIDDHHDGKVTIPQPISEYTANDWILVTGVRRVACEIFFHLLRTFCDEPEEDLRNLFLRTSSEDDNKKTNDEYIPPTQIQSLPSDSTILFEKILRPLTKTCFEELKYGTPTSIFCCLFRLIGYHPVIQTYDLQTPLHQCMLASRAPPSSLKHRCFFSCEQECDYMSPAARDNTSTLYSLELVYKGFPSVNFSDNNNNGSSISNFFSSNALKMAALLVSDEDIVETLIDVGLRFINNSSQRENSNDETNNSDEKNTTETASPQHCFARQCTQLLAHFIFIEVAVEQELIRLRSSSSSPGKVSLEKIYTTLLGRINVKDRMIQRNRELDGEVSRNLKMLEKASLFVNFVLESYTKYVIMQTGL